MKKFAIYDTTLGQFIIEYDGEIVLTLQRIEKSKTNLLEGNKNNFTDLVFKQLEEYFAGERKIFDFIYKPEGTEFQMKVWKALTEIPYGETCSYLDIAVKIGNPKASRAVGGANNKNPLMIVIPCHRVVGKRGNLIGYAGGLEMKQRLLKIEEANKL